MSAVLKDDEVLETAIAGLSRVAQAITSMPSDDRAKALEAVEHSQELGHDSRSIIEHCRRVDKLNI